MNYSGNITADMYDKEREKRNAEHKQCPDCGSEDGLHYCLCNREISAENCHNGVGCPDCR